MPALVFLVGSEVPAWVLDPPDVLIGKLEAATAGTLLPVVAIDFDEDDGEYVEYTAYLRVDQVAFVRPPTREGRRSLAAARGD